MTMMERIVEVEMMEDKDVRTMYDVSKVQLLKVFKRLLFEELESEFNKKEVKVDRKKKEVKEEVKETPKTNS
jgi:hypothetical protein